MSPVPQLTAEQVWAANGSNEVMLHLLQAFGGPGRTALSFAPTYSMYPEYARDTNTAWVTGRREAEDFTLDQSKALAAISRAPAVRRAAGVAEQPDRYGAADRPGRGARRPDRADCGAVLVVDEAYAEFRRAGTPSAVTLLPSYPNLAVARTMSKAFALAGARVGYLAASKQLVDALRIVRLPYHLSAVTQAVARAALRHSDELLGRVEQLRIERDETVEWLRSLGLRAVDSDANFVLFGTFADRHAVWQALLDDGVLIRETGPDGWLRVSIGTAARDGRLPRLAEKGAEGNGRLWHEPDRSDRARDQ